MVKTGDAPMNGDTRPICAVCGRPALGRALFRFSRSGGVQRHRARCAVRHPRLARQAAKTALGVGALLVLIDHRAVCWTGPVTVALVAKTLFTLGLPCGGALRRDSWRSDGGLFFTFLSILKYLDRMERVPARCYRPFRA